MKIKKAHKKCIACTGKGTIPVGDHDFPRFGTLQIEADCSVCDGEGLVETKIIIRRKGEECINKNLRPIVTEQTVRSVVGLAV